jgi:hypothetical protein
MYTKLALALLVITAAVFVDQSSADIQCYACAAVEACGSGDDFKKDGAGVTTVNCTDTCLKTTTNAGDIKTYGRGCGTKGETTGCVGVSSAQICTDTCDTNLCNGATSVNVAFATIASVLLFTITKLFL